VTTTDLSSSDESNKDNNNTKNMRTINSDYTPKQYYKSRKNLHVEPIATNKEFSNNAVIKSKLPKWPSSINDSRNEQHSFVNINEIIDFQSEYYIHTQQTHIITVT